MFDASSATPLLDYPIRTFKQFYNKLPTGNHLHSVDLGIFLTASPLFVSPERCIMSDIDSLPRISWVASAICCVESRIDIWQICSYYFKVFVFPIRSDESSPHQGSRVIDGRLTGEGVVGIWWWDKWSYQLYIVLVPKLRPSNKKEIVQVYWHCKSYTRYSLVFLRLKVVYEN